jgi:hypothetical protein
MPASSTTKTWSVNGTEPTGIATNAATDKIAVKSAAVASSLVVRRGKSSTLHQNEEVTM